MFTIAAAVEKSVHKLLLVEDQKIDRTVFAAALQHAGFKVIAVAGAIDALAAFDEHPDIAVLVTDVLLPGAHGFALARMARQRRPALLVLHYSVQTPLPPREMELAQGPVVEKPVDPAQLVAHVRALLSG